jgi:hypothetical protein
MLATPTFAVGIGIIVAAALAYSTTQTHLVFSGGDPACVSASCTTSITHNNGGEPLRSSDQREHGASRGSRAAAGGAQEQQGANSARVGSPGSPAGGHAGQPAGSRDPKTSAPGTNRAPVIEYKTLRRWRGGFDAAVTLTNRSKTTITGWQLWLRYQTNQINRIWHAAWFPANSRAPASGLVVPQRGEQLLKPGEVYRFEFQANGPAGSPIGCLFNGYRCNFTR